MYLKRIEAKGFKSFADRIELELKKGITGVVGPNGSGKSNISDAVRWVLGEQSAKSLRGTKMEDVIFSGTETRKPLGFAEVSITIDNADNLLPMEYSEITVTRRMFRSGESEYYINGTSCRLKDITELFMDTGVGKDGYSIIGQGQVDEIINARPEDRREIFEEAAGIVKYKSRKQEAEKKLESTEENITRIEDIIRELEAQIGPLLEQSDKAKKYLNLKEKLKVLELNVFIISVEKLKEKILSAEENLSNLEEELINNKKKNARLELDYESVKSKITDFDNIIEDLKSEVFSCDNEIEKLQGEINVYDEKIKNIENNILRLDDEIEAKKERSQNLSMQKVKNSENLANYRQMLNEQERILEAKSREFLEINEKIGEKEKYIESMKAEIIEIMNMISERKSSINSLTAFINNIEKRKNQIVHERGIKVKKIEELEAEFESLKSDLESEKSEYISCKSDIERLEKERNEVANHKKTLEKSAFELSGKMHSIKARHRALCEMETGFEGYIKSVKEIMKLRDKNILSGICGVVADIIKVPKNLETAVEIALGSALQDIVTEDETIAKRCIEYLKQNQFGRATFLPLTTVSGKYTIRDIKNIKDQKGFIGFASELISYDKRYTNIIYNLLGRVIIAENIDYAINIAKYINYSMKIVTIEGDVINPGGSFTGGSVGHRASSFLGRKREIKELENDISELKKSIDIINENIKIADDKLSSFEQQLKKAVDKRYSIEKKLSNYENNINIIKNEIKGFKEDISNLDKESLELDSENEEMILKMKDESDKLEELEKKNDEITKIVQFEQTGTKDILDYKEKISSDITSLKVNIAEIRQNITSHEEKISEINSEIEKLNSDISDKYNEKHSFSDEMKKIKEDIEKINSDITSIIVKRESSKEKLEDAYEGKKKYAASMQEMEQHMKDLSQSAEMLQGEIHKIEMQKARLEMEIENLQNRIWDDYEISYAAASRYKTDIGNVNHAVKEINSIKDEIKSLGAVNVGAIEEYKKVKERYDFLMKQKNDLKEAKESLEKVISEMTEKMRTQFVKNFAVINDNFNATFRDLFGGGQAKLILTDSNNVLESGVEIVAEPPGKKFQSLTLLSGGEKALCAIALLFAILRMKPSPFCILDEIEAALDDVNVVRFANFLRELSKDTQFIIVTHRKGTMEIADVLYGVTMEEKGVSKLVSVKLVEMAS